MKGKDWFRNILFAVGQQWIIFERGRWRNRILPAWFPRAQTNTFQKVANDLKTALLQTNRAINYRPANDDPASQSTAEICERVREVFYEECRVESKEEELASWLVLTGNAFLINYYDFDKRYGTVTVEGLSCQNCGEFITQPEMQAQARLLGGCPVCQQGPVTPGTQELPIGSLNTDVCSPFEIRLDHRIRTWEEQHRFVRLRRYDLDYAKETWPDYADSITADFGNDLSQYYLDVLAHVTGSFSASGGFIGGAPFSPKNPKVTVYEFYELPSEDFPDGLRAVRLGQGTMNVVEADELPTEYGSGVRKGQKFLPLNQFGFDVVPGRFWRKTRMDDLIAPQMFRNTVEANLRLTAQRMGNAIWLDPKGSGVDALTGEPGQVVKYNPVSLGGTSFAKPERIPAELSNVQPMLILIKMLDDQMERLAGTFYLESGQAPPGVTAASALAFLGEKGQKALSPFVQAWAKGWKCFEEQQLELARANWDDTRIRVMAGRNKQWETMKFMKSDLQGAVNVVIDYNSLFPKSQATERATLAQLAQFGVINPADPEQNWRILEIFGETKIKGSVDLDVREAVKEADAFLTSGAPPELVPLVQNSQVHLIQHTDFAKTDEFKTLPIDQKQIWYDHIKATVADIVARQVAFQSLGVDPNEPMMTEMSSAEAQIAAGVKQNLTQTPTSMGGQMPDGAEAPDQRLGTDGKFKNAQTPDIAAPNLNIPQAQAPPQ